MKKIVYTLLLAGGLLSTTSCSDWLEILPKNEQVTDEYWQSKEDVEAVVASGYYYMRKCVSNFIDYGELRAGSVYTTKVDKVLMEGFQMLSTDGLAKWEPFYKIINMANSVLDYAQEVPSIDDTYTQEAMYSHQTEAYFMRALTYFYLVRNWKEVPLILHAYVDDSYTFNIPKSTETEIIAQIKSDIEAALATGAAKEYFDGSTPWKNKGRATKWALYALMADVCLWSEDYDKCVEYADYLINANASFRPVFIQNGGDEWFKIFNPGNSNESIFELNFDATLTQESGSPSSTFGSVDGTCSYEYSMPMLQRLVSETEEAGGQTGRAYFGAYVPDADVYSDALRGYIWKYIGGDTSGDKTFIRTNKDANWIIYRMTDVMLMKAEALIRKGGSQNWGEALSIINKVRVRAGLPESDIVPEETDELTMLELLLNERDMEFAGEGKRWYDLMRFGKAENFKFKSNFIQMVVENNQISSPSWITSVLEDEYAWYLPIHEDELTVNTQLVQNPYYSGTSQK